MEYFCNPTLGTRLESILQPAKSAVSPYSSPFARDVSPGGTPAPQRQKFHTDDVNQCLHNKPGSLGVPKENLLVHMFLLVDYGKVLCSSANELHQNSNSSAKKNSIHSTNIDCCVVDSSRLRLNFVTVCLLFLAIKKS